MKNPKATGLKEHQLIPFPCHLDWKNLELHESGNKHCSECDCEVRDLTDMSADEIYSLQDRLGGKLCGKIYKKNNYVVTEVESSDDRSPEDKPSILTIPKIISGGIAALSLASCSSTEITEQKPGRTEAKPFPNDAERKPVKEVKRIEEPPCLMGVIALPPRN